MKPKFGDQPLVPEETQKAESMLTDELREQSEEREEAYETLQPPRFIEKTGTMLFDIDPRLIYADKIREWAETQGFKPKHEFHVTIVGYKNGKNLKILLSDLSPEERKERLAAIRRLIEETDWTLDGHPKLYHVTKEYEFESKYTGEKQKEVRESIVQTMALRHLNEFYQELSRIVDPDQPGDPNLFPPQFPHLTLFTKGTDPNRARRGIGIDTEDDFKLLSPELIEV